MLKKSGKSKNYSFFRKEKKIQTINAQRSLALLAGGVGAYLLGKFAYRYYQDHPEISEFIKESYENVGHKIKELGGVRGDEEVARH